MNSTVIILTLGCLNFAVAATGYGQNVTLTVRDAKIYTVMEAIEKETGYTFMYKKSDLERLGKVDLHVVDAKLNDVLEQIFAKQKGFSFRMRNSVVVVKSLPFFSVPGTLTPKPLFVGPLVQRDVRGIVTDSLGTALVGVTVSVKGNTKAVTSTDQNGRYVLSVPDQAMLVFTMVGFLQQEVAVGGRDVIDVKLAEDQAGLEEVVVVAFGGQQKRREVVSAVTSVTPSELRVPSSNLTTAFAGRIAGLISYQRTGEPGQDNAQFFIRGVTSFGTGKVDPLVLIDNVEMTTEDLARLTVDDIASFSIMKDANATALYGARGANGVILVTTKEGREGEVKIQLRSEGSFSGPTENVDYADGVTYMKLHNEAVRTRMPGTRLPYEEKKINYTERGIDPLYYPTVDWQDLLFDQNTFNQRYNLNVSGGGRIARYYIAAAYTKDQGILKVDNRQNFNNNISLNKYSLRSNINVNLTNTTEAIVRLSGVFDDYQGPLDGGTALYNKAVLANPVLFLPYYEPDASTIYANHILYGNTSAGNYLNPYAEMLKGYRSNDRSAMYVQFELKQNLDFVTKGLSARGLMNVNRFAQLEVRRQYAPFFYALPPQVAGLNDYRLLALNPDGGTDYLDFVPGDRRMENTMYFEGALQYRTMLGEKHSLSALVVGTLRERKDNTYNTLQLSLPQRNLGVAGRATYSYNDSYFLEANFGYNGSERFSQHERWGFFPSVGGGWIVSNEPFMKRFENSITKLKLRATYGLVGNDEIGLKEDRFYYLSNVNMNDGGRGISFGDNFGYGRSGISISRYEDPFITWEISQKTNVGLELNLWNSLEIQADYFREVRSNILQARADIPTSMGLQAIPKANIGKAVGRGGEFSVDYNKSFANGMWAVVRGNFTYAASRFELYEEPDYSATPWRSRMGQKISQRWGYIAERLFVDDEEVKNSPVQTFGEYQAGDIKYKDINRDGRIDENDQVPIGYPTTPEIIYGFGVSMGYKNFDFSVFFQGSDRSSFWIDPNAVAPFIAGSTDVTTLTNTRALLQVIADNHWSEDNRNSFAFWPRLSDNAMSNNNVTSTWWLRNGSFLRVKTAEMGYTLPSRPLERFGVRSLRVYASGNNLFQLRKFDLWDPEQAGNAFNYPLQRVINVGVNIEF